MQLDMTDPKNWPPGFDVDAFKKEWTRDEFGPQMTMWHAHCIKIGVDRVGPGGDWTFPAPFKLQVNVPNRRMCGVIKPDNPGS
jgi:hypothetical protein